MPKIQRKSSAEKEVMFYQSFGDMVSLLMVFFVFLFSMSTLDATKFKELTESINSIFEIKTDDQIIDEYKQEREILEKLFRELTDYIETENLKDDVKIKIEDHSIKLDLGSKMLFTSASADLKKRAKTIFLAFVEYFKSVESAKIVIEGHSDDIPIRTEQFPSNWELSSSRAASVVRFLASSGIPEKNMYIIAYNQFNPLVPNDSEANRSKNRRVRLIFKPVVTPADNTNMIDSVNFDTIKNFDADTEILDVEKEDEEIDQKATDMEDK
jgi:chemotaxis protein MotB